jgi:hypothetical protein
VHYDWVGYIAVGFSLVAIALARKLQVEPGA